MLEKNKRLPKNTSKLKQLSIKQTFLRVPSPPKKLDVDGESFRQSLIIRFLMGVPESRVIRLYNCTPYDRQKDKYIRKATGLTPKGLPDLLFISKVYGVHFFEVKSVKEYSVLHGKMYKFRAGRLLKSHEHINNQIRLHDEINSYGVAKCHFVCCVEQVKQALGLPFEIPKL